MATSIGYLDQERKKLRSTEPKDIEDDNFPSQIQSKSTDYFFMITQIECATAYTNQTDRFPYQSARGHNYFIIGYDFDPNVILAQLLKNRETESLIAAWIQLHHQQTKKVQAVKNTY